MAEGERICKYCHLLIGEPSATNQVLLGDDGPEAHIECWVKVPFVPKKEATP